ncbi:MAG: FxLYD domain-containing protein [Candidatus Omnitrophica bacterium]|nr:FxLYD domain-containing protein [Candidatus Omnitrophota bacterium]MBU1048204.1 FxLYD domain-containing protein [Candidatus Omnitrophota bacterium]MBU1767400.1 FxLYD domain-containing protein [Candidatus Omnitrophota bacterium]MBU1888702.1 FxLYD domain-containing protein [Candidatus Omnitrophota bacterium]
MDEKQMKECKSCYQQIDSRAKRCPHCHHWQTKFSVFIHHPLSGFIYGFLFIAIMFTAIYFIGKKVEKSFDYTYRDFSQDSGLIIKSHHEWFPTEDSFNVVGVVANTGSDAWGSINIEVELFDKEGKFVYECSEYIRGTLRPGEEENFVVDCSGCDKAPIPKFDHYEIKITNAYYKSVDKK